MSLGFPMMEAILFEVGVLVWYRICCGGLCSRYRYLGRDHKRRVQVALVQCIRIVTQMVGEIEDRESGTWG